MDYPTPPPNVNVCSTCGGSDCNGHPVFAVLMVVALLIVPIVIGLVIARATS